jgi:type II secretory pathway pseudopilin PulG
MIEIALCLAIISFALLVIIGVLPGGMNTQRATREETIIGQDATMLLEAIRSGSRGFDDLTNNVYAITNYVTQFNKQGQPMGPPIIAGYTYTSGSWDGSADNSFVITNGQNIIGVLSTPEYTSGLPISSANIPMTAVDILGNFYSSNHVVAYVRSFSGLAVEKPPQDNQLMQQDTFTYRILCVNAPMAADTNTLDKSSQFYSAYNNILTANLRELRLTFLWPQLPNGNIGGGRQTFRASVSGQMFVPNNAGMALYFYQPQSFSTNAP